MAFFKREKERERRERERKERDDYVASEVLMIEERSSSATNNAPCCFWLLLIMCDAEFLDLVSIYVTTFQTYIVLFFSCHK